MKTRGLRLMLATGLVLSLFAGVIGSAGAFHDIPDECDLDDISGDASQAHAYFPWVSNGADDLDGLGPFYSTVTIQSLTQFPADDEIEVDLYVGQDGGGYDLAETINLAPNESQTLSADALDIPEGEGAPVVAVAFDVRPETEEVEDEDVCEILGEYGRIAGVAKVVGPVMGNNGATSSAHETVDGYTGLVGDQVALPDWADGTYILPIAQNNAGWNTILRVANMSESGGLTNVTATFYGSGQQGFAGVSHVENLQLRAGEVASVDVSDHLPDEWVGSVYFTSSADIGVVADRYKVSDSMLINTTARPEHLADTEHFGALIFKEYNFWNTGISIANVEDNRHNSVTVSYVGPTNNIVGQDTVTVPPRGMEFIYTPGTQDLGLFDGFVGSVIIEGTESLIAAIDQVKYQGNDPDVGQAMSYVTEGPYKGDDSDHALVMPLVQKGNPITGLGDTSGIQLFNTDDDDDQEVEIVFFGANGLPVAPTVVNNNPDPITISMQPRSHYTLYTHAQSELSSGFQGSVVADVLDDGEIIVGVSNNVNYAVDGDGSAAFNLVRDPFFPGFFENNNIS